MKSEPINGRPPNDGESPTIDAPSALANLVRYARRGQSLERCGTVAADEILFIDETTEPPQAAPRTAALPASERPQAADVFYIGPE